MESKFTREFNTDLKKRYWVLGWDQYYPLGGLDNVIASFDEKQEALEYEQKCEDNEAYDLTFTYDSVEKETIQKIKE